MRRTSWACCSRLLALLALSIAPALALVQPHEAWVLFSPAVAPPGPDASWRTTPLPDSTAAPFAWYRVQFVVAARPRQPWAVYLPYLYGGGRLFLNGEPLADIREASAETVVRWERPHLVPLPDVLLRPGANELAIRVAATPIASIRMPLLKLGPTDELLPSYDSRLFWTRTMAQFSVIACLVVGVLTLSIWWRRREEALHGLFGVAALLWGLRTLTFVVEELPTGAWHAWRALYYAATGGFAIAMLLFALQLAGIRAGRVRWILVAYWLLGPLGYLASGGNELLIGRFWTGGLLPIGGALLAVSALAAWRQRTAPLLVLCASLALAVLAGVHDYLLATAAPLLRWFAPEAAAHRVFLLHYAADILLVAMGTVLAARLVGTLGAIEQLNRTLEARVADSERLLASNYERLRGLERRHAATEERQQIMRDLHDGLGSQLFVTLSRAEAGHIEHAEIVEALRECIADMRLTLEAMGPAQGDFLEAWSDFRFRWQQLLEGAGIESIWRLDGPRDALALAPHITLQLLRIVQEALTNAMKHARATRVSVSVQASAERLRIEVRDDGDGLARAAGGEPGYGLANMRARAERLGAALDISDSGAGVRVLIDFDCRRLAVA